MLIILKLNSLELWIPNQYLFLGDNHATSIMVIKNGGLFTFCAKANSFMKFSLIVCVLCTIWMLLYYSLSTEYFVYVVALRNNSRATEIDPSNELFTNSTTIQKHCFDVHIDESGDIYSECTPHHGTKWGEPKKQIAIGGGITSTGLKAFDRETLKARFPLFNVLLPSFCRTLTKGYHYHFYLAYDSVDSYFKSNENQKEFSSIFYDKVLELCPKDVNVSLHLVVCSHHKKPAWAQNDAMLEAYIDNMEYFYR